MICLKCGFEQDDGGAVCAACGVIFAKIRERQGEDQTISPPNDPRQTDRRSTFQTLLFPLPAEPQPVAIAARALLLVVLALWSTGFLLASVDSNAAGRSFMHLVNLPFHEAGHIIFSPLGRFMQVLGGTLGQLIMPAVCLAVLLLRTRDAFGAAVAQWWLAESFMDIAPYVNDARALNLVLLGGVTGREVSDYHDWEYLLRTLGLLRMDHALAYLAQATGIALMTAALLWAAANVWLQFKIYRAIR
ncbi:MAG: zinc ribbon domain-containing protein [Desulfobacteraceae bacterium]|nr:MAG: zinc ribbon domain-containing protein [Desulfobacteraceae bacterium]